MNHAPVLAWHGDPELKAAAVTRMRDHRAADESTYATQPVPGAH